MKEVRIQDAQPVDPERLRVGTLNEHTETQKLESATEQIGHIEQLRPEVWSQLTETQREWALRRVGEKLSHVYECPAPPFIGSTLPPSEAGGYSDRNYLTRMNRQELRSSDVGEALDTYCHEFRHAYQHEMAGRYRSAFRHLCHDEAKAARWDENLRHYVPPEQGLEKYMGQPVENDAREFAARIREGVRRRQAHTGA